jgi:hypothetical protein
LRKSTLWTSFRAGFGVFGAGFAAFRASPDGKFVLWGK